MNREEIIRNIIDSFFKGIDYFDEPEIGFIWIASHGSKRVNRRVLEVLKEKYNENYSEIKPPYLTTIDTKFDNFGYIADFETLTIEPKEGGQYEVAVRIWSEDKWRGYKINDFDSRHYLVGINTRGH